MSLSIKQNYRGNIFEIGQKVIQGDGTAILWISIGNSYFTQDVIRKTVEFMHENFTSSHVIVPYKPAIYTYRAMGYDTKDAIKKARLQGNRLINHINKSLNLGMNPSLINRDNQVVANNDFNKQLEVVTNLYNNNELFAKDANTITRDVVQSKLKANMYIEDAVMIGVNYLLEELAFVLASTKILNANHSAYVYHKRREILENLIHGVYDGITRPQNGFIVLNMD